MIHLSIGINIAGRGLSKSYLDPPSLFSSPVPTAMAPKYFIPLESNPDVFNALITCLGISPNLRFQDVWTLEDTNELLSIPVLALVLVFPTTPAYDARAQTDDADADDWMVTHQ